MSKIGQLSAEIEYPEHVKFFVDTHGSTLQVFVAQKSSSTRELEKSKKKLNFFSFLETGGQGSFKNHDTVQCHVMHLRKVCPPGARNCQFSRAGMALGKHDKLAPWS